MKKMTFLILFLILTFKFNAQIKDMDYPELFMSVEEFNKIGQECLDSIIRLKNNNIAYGFDISSEFEQPYPDKNTFTTNSILVKAYLNFRLKDIEFTTPWSLKQNSEIVKLFFDWPVIDILSGDLFITIQCLSSKFLTKYHFRINRKEFNFHISELLTSVTMPHMSSLLTEVDTNEITKEVIRRNDLLLDSITKNLKSVPQKKNKSL